MRPCPACNGRPKKYGPATTLASGFRDQIIICPACGWCGVESKFNADDEGGGVQPSLPGPLDQPLEGGMDNQNL